jgi:hypothetical protein
VKQDLATILHARDHRDLVSTVPVIMPCYPKAMLWLLLPQARAARYESGSKTLCLFDGVAWQIHAPSK